MNLLNVGLSLFGIVATGVATILLIRAQHQATRLARAYADMNPFGHQASWGQIDVAPDYIRASLALQGGSTWESALLVLGLVAQAAALLV